LAVLNKNKWEEKRCEKGQSGPARSVCDCVKKGSLDYHGGNSTNAQGQERKRIAKVPKTQKSRNVIKPPSEHPVNL